MSKKIIEKDLSFYINSLLFKVHNELGRFCRERQYADAFENILKSEKVVYEREKVLPHLLIERNFTNRVDFVINNRLLVDIKAKPLVPKGDYYQMNRYLEASGYQLGLIVNFRNNYLKPIRVIRSHS